MKFVQLNMNVNLIKNCIPYNKFLSSYKILVWNRTNLRSCIQRFTSTESSNTNSNSNDNFQAETDQIPFNNECYIELSPLQKLVLSVGTGLSSFLDPTRPESIAVFGEVTAEIALRNLYKKMLEDPEGALILKEKPRINSRTIDLDKLRKMDEDTVGRTYFNFLEKNEVTPDSRLQVRFIKDPQLAYVMQRYREIHDLVHSVSGQPTNMLGEVVVKWIEGIQTGLPMCVLGGLFGATRLKPKQRKKYMNNYVQWAIQVGNNSKPFINIYYEKRWDQSIYELREYISPYLNKSPSSITN